MFFQKRKRKTQFPSMDRTAEKVVKGGIILGGIAIGASLVSGIVGSLLHK